MVKLPTHEELVKHLEYDPKTGVFTRKVSGKKADTDMTIGYKRVRITISGVKYEILSHRLAMYMVYGTWPCDEVDHINGDRKDNRIVNLRYADRSENMRNTRRRSDNTSGITGIRKHQNGWRVSISKKYVGYYGCFAKAVKARKKAELEHGYHTNHGRH